VHLDDERLYLLLDRYLAGEASAAEAQAVREWLAEDPAPEHAALLEDLRLIRRAAARPVPDTSVEGAWAKARKSLGGPRVSRRLLMVTLAAAAVLIAVIGGGRVLWRAPQWKEYATAAAQRMVIRLQDGTQVTIAPKSRVRYMADFGRVHRDLYLDGEAYFQVAPDSQRPLRVHTSGSVTEDLGTAFVVTAYADQRTTEVVVTEGRVSLSRAETTSPAVVLGLRDLGRLDASGPATVRRGVDVDRYLAWTKGVLAFDGTPLRDVVLTLGRWYNVDIHLESADSALGARRLTATFTNESIDRVVERIALTLGLRVERGPGSVVVLRNDR
jgi:ferric-dicitrate binding protein FerR (iron transport regulator)